MTPAEISSLIAKSDQAIAACSDTVKGVDTYEIMSLVLEETLLLTMSLHHPRECVRHIAAAMGLIRLTVERLEKQQAEEPNAS